MYNNLYKNYYTLIFLYQDLVGICSYLLVNFWYTRIAANQSSISALLTNRVGDCFLTIGMFAILWSFGNVDYATVFSLAPFISENIITIIGICLLIGAMAKSSQYGLHVWLPLAISPDGKSCKRPMDSSSQFSTAKGMNK